MLARVFVVLPVFLASAACGSHPSAGGGTTPGTGRGNEAELHSLFEHLPPPVVRDDGPARLVLRDGPRVPTPGHTELAFPSDAPDGGPPDAGPAGPLHVLGYSPRGTDALVGAVRITFDQPMVPLEMVSATQAEHVPMQIAPQPPGHFRWLGTQTVVFEPTDVRMPMATDYRVTIPQGTTSALGGALEQETHFAFRTPPLTVVDSFPTDTSEPLSPLIGFHFNERVDAQAILAALRFSGPSAGAPLTLVDGASEIERAKNEHPEIGVWEDGRFVLLRPSAPLAVDTGYGVTLPAGTKGTEGPLGLARPAILNFRTYGALRVSSVRCSSGDRCVPGDTLYLEATNPLAAQDLASLVTVTPAVTRMDVRGVAGDSGVVLSGDFAAATTYTITLGAALKDTFGQTLAAPFTTTKHFGDALPSANYDAETFATLELGSPRVVPMTITNVRRVTVRAARVPSGKMIEAARAAMSGWYYGDNYATDDPFHVLGVAPRVATLPVRGTRNAVERIGVDVTAEVAASQPGMALVAVEVPDRDIQDRRLFLVQATDLGITTLIDGLSAVARVTSLSHGTPLAGVTVELHHYGDVASSHPFASSTTGADGVARLGIAASESQSQIFVVARAGADTALVSAWHSPIRSVLTGAIFTERNPYRPGDTVHVRGVVRQRRADARGTIVSLPSGTRLGCHTRDPDGQDSPWDATPDEFGTFTREIETHEGAPTGVWSIYCDRSQGAADYSNVSGTFSIEEYRAPEIAVHVTAEDGTRTQGDHVQLTVASEYLFGAPAAGLPVTWTLGREATSYAPPGHDDYTFGDATVWRWGRPVHIHSEHRWGRDRPFFGLPQGERDIVKRGTTTLDATGKLVVPAVLDAGDDIDGPAKFVLEAQVTDTSRQQVAGRVEVIAHPASLYAGVRLDQPFIRESDPIVVHAITTNVAGALQAGKAIAVRLVEQRGHLVAHEVAGLWIYEWQNDEHEVGTCAVTSASAPVDCRLAPQRPGEYVLEAKVRDEHGHTQTTRTLVFVFGSTFVPSEQAGTIELLADHAGAYEAGTTAHVLVRAPFANGHGLLAFERAGMAETRAFDLDGNLTVVDVPIADADVPSTVVRVVLSRGRASDAELAALLASAGPDAQHAAADDVGHPTWAAGQLTLQVNDAPKRLTVDVHPDHAELGPGDQLGIDVAVHGAHDHGKPALVSIALVDEGVLSLLGYETPDPVPTLQPAPADTTQPSSLFDSIVRRRQARQIGRPQGGLMGDDVGEAFGYGGLGLRGTGRGGGGTGEGTIGLGALGTIGHGSGQGYGSGAGGFQPVARATAAPTTPMDLMREHSGSNNGPTTAAGETAGETPAAARGLFATTAFYRASVRTDREGKAHVDVTLPDNLTTFRIMAMAIATDDTSGEGDATIRVRKPVVLRPALPRFATWGDTFEAQVVVHNETGEASEVVVGIRAAGVVIEGDGIERIHLAAGASQLVTFPARVDAGGGTARVQFAASAGHGSDAAELDLPIVQPATAEAFATYGSVTDGAVQIPVHAPTGVIDRFGGLDLQLSATAMTGLDDAVDYLIDYPYLCAEQHASQLVAAAAMKQILEGRDADGVTTATTLGAASIAELRRYQRWDGGFVYWPEMRETDLYVSSWVVFALGEARRAGLVVPDDTLHRGLQFVERRVRNPRHDLGEDTAWAEQAFGLYVLAENGRVPPADLLQRVHGHRRDLPVFAMAWLDVALRKASAGDPRAAELWRQISNGSVETAGSAHFAEQRVESARLLWHSERRTDAIVLADLLERDWHDPLAEKVVRGLVASRRGGHWTTTNETAWALDSLVRYYRLAEADVPDLHVQSWLGTQLAFETAFQGRTAAVAEGRVPMHDLLAMTGDLGFTIQPHGTGRLYYRLGLRYAPSDLRLPAVEQGFTVSRRYEAVGDPSTVTRDADGVWHVKVESDVRVRVTLVIQDDRYDVALDDPLPAGLEPTNMAFRTTATQRLSGSLDEQRVDFGNYWALFAFDHRELRDDRVVAFARFAPAGVYELTYLAHATTPGRFLATATHAEEMYAPENFGRATTEYVVVEH